ncbi:MAG: Gfo/Idh/MocA family oxidoreductase [Verrucomicrobia bacterium]|nr:Gfo/Idh/MocA family oxidoreductase [Verrucomicrobiota bacterium]
MKRLSRRNFLKAGSLATLAATIGFPTIIPSKAFGANDKIVMAAIGLGGQGLHDMRSLMASDKTRFVAVCEVDTDRLENAVNVVNEHYNNKDCKRYGDFREIIARKDIDAVTVTTPDHWHAIISVAAAKAGKHIYCEKPLANSIAESKAVRDAVRKYNVVLQTGSHERSRSNARYAAELVRNGYIGKLKEIIIQMPTVEEHHNRIRQFTSVPAVKPPIPKNLDYDMWLGHTPIIQYYPERLHHQWRFHLNFGAGEMSDRGAHVIDIGQLGHGSDDTGPTEIFAKGWDADHGIYNTPMEFEFENTYADGVKLIGGTVIKEGTRPGGRGVKFVGEDGWVFEHIHEGTLEASNPEWLELIDENGTLGHENRELRKQFKVNLGRTSSHYANFLDCIQSGQRPFADVEIGHRSATICLLNMLSMRLGRPLKWDPVAEQIVGDVEASELMMPEWRGDWKLS